MKIELLTKEEIKQIKEFPNDIKNKLLKFMSTTQVDVIMELIKYNRKEDVLFLTELNKYFKSIQNEKMKLKYFMAWYIVKKDILDKKPVTFKHIGLYEESLECKALMYLFSKFIGKKYNKEEAHIRYKSWLYELIEDGIEKGIVRDTFAGTIYMDSYKHWLVLMDSIADVLNNVGIIKIGK